MEFTIGIVTYNRPDYMDQLLEDIVEQGQHPDQIIIVDDSEEEETREVVEAHRDAMEAKGIELLYRWEEGKTTFGESRNKVIEEASGDVICFIDDDVRLPEDWLANVAETYEEYPEAAGVGGPAITTDESRNLLVEIDRSSNNQNRYNRYGEVIDISDRWVPPEPVETQTFRGANMSFRTEKLREIGGFDEGYQGTGYREEQDVMVRLGKRGETLIYDPDMKLHHLQAQSGGTRTEHQNTAYWIGRNLIYFVRKNFPENYRMALLRLLLHTGGTPPPLWKDFAGMFVYRDFSRLWKFKGYIDEIINGG